LNLLFNSKAENAKDAIRVNTKILPMLQADKKSGEFEDADWELMKKIAEKNEVQYPIGIFGQAMQVFEEGKDVEEGKAGEKE